MQISKIDSIRITILRALALTSVVSAHTASVVLKDKGTVFCSDVWINRCHSFLYYIWISV